MKTNYLIKKALLLALISVVATSFAQTVTVKNNAAAGKLTKSKAASGTTEIWIEAERGTVGSSWQEISDTQASGGKYIKSVTGHENRDIALADETENVAYSFKITEAGDYNIWGRVIAPTTDNDSFWVKMDDLDYICWNTMPILTNWGWNFVFDINTDQNTPVVYNLTKGTHYLYFCMREDTVQLDKILISNTGITPTGQGGSPMAVEAAQKLSDISISPNPSKGIVNIECNDGFNSLNVFNQLGQLVYNENYNVQLQQKRVDLKLKPGIYFVSLNGNMKSGVSKLIIK